MAIRRTYSLKSGGSTPGPALAGTSSAASASSASALGSSRLGSARDGASSADAPDEPSAATGHASTNAFVMSMAGGALGEEDWGDDDGARERERAAKRARLLRQFSGLGTASSRDVKGGTGGSSETDEDGQSRSGAAPAHALRTTSSLRASGQSAVVLDDVGFLLDGLTSATAAARADSVTGLARLFASREVRDLVRAHGLAHRVAQTAAALAQGESQAGAAAAPGGLILPAWMSTPKTDTLAQALAPLDREAAFGVLTLLYQLSLDGTAHFLDCLTAGVATFLVRVLAHESADLLRAASPGHAGSRTPGYGLGGSESELAASSSSGGAVGAGASARIGLLAGGGGGKIISNKSRTVAQSQSLLESLQYCYSEGAGAGAVGGSGGASSARDTLSARADASAAPGHSHSRGALAAAAKPKPATDSVDFGADDDEEAAQGAGSAPAALGRSAASAGVAAFAAAAPLSAPVAASETAVPGSLRVARDLHGQVHPVNVALFLLHRCTQLADDDSQAAGAGGGGEGGASLTDAADSKALAARVAGVRDALRTAYGGIGLQALACRVATAARCLRDMLTDTAAPLQSSAGGAASSGVQVAPRYVLPLSQLQLCLQILEDVSFMDDDTVALLIQTLLPLSLMQGTTAGGNKASAGLGSVMRASPPSMQASATSVSLSSALLAVIEWAMANLAARALLPSHGDASADGQSGGTAGGGASITGVKRKREGGSGGCADGASGANSSGLNEASDNNPLMDVLHGAMRVLINMTNNSVAGCRSFLAARRPAVEAGGGGQATAAAAVSPGGTAGGFWALLVVMRVVAAFGLESKAGAATSSLASNTREGRFRSGATHVAQGADALLAASTGGRGSRHPMSPTRPRSDAGESATSATSSTGGGSGSSAVAHSAFDALVLSLGLLTNVFEHEHRARDAVRQVSVATGGRTGRTDAVSAPAASAAAGLVSAPTLLARLFVERYVRMRLHVEDTHAEDDEEAAMDVDEGGGGGSGTDKPALAAEALVNPDDLVVAAYLALLLACAMQQHGDNQDEILGVLGTALPEARGGVAAAGEFDRGGAVDALLTVLRAFVALQTNAGVLTEDAATHISNMEVILQDIKDGGDGSVTVDAGRGGAGDTTGASSRPGPGRRGSVHDGMDTSTDRPSAAATQRRGSSSGWSWASATAWARGSEEDDDGDAGGASDTGLLGGSVSAIAEPTLASATSAGGGTATAPRSAVRGARLAVADGRGKARAAVTFSSSRDDSSSADGDDAAAASTSAAEESSQSGSDSDGDSDSDFAGNGKKNAAGASAAAAAPTKAAGAPATKAVARTYGSAGRSSNGQGTTAAPALPTSLRAPAAAAPAPAPTLSATRAASPAATASPRPKASPARSLLSASSATPDRRSSDSAASSGRKLPRAVGLAALQGTAVLHSPSSPARYSAVDVIAASSDDDDDDDASGDVRAVSRAAAPAALAATAPVPASKSATKPSGGSILAALRPAATSAKKPGLLSALAPAHAPAPASARSAAAVSRDDDDDDDDDDDGLPAAPMALAPAPSWSSAVGSSYAAARSAREGGASVEEHRDEPSGVSAASAGASSSSQTARTAGSSSSGASSIWSPTAPAGGKSAPRTLWRGFGASSAAAAGAATPAGGHASRSSASAVRGDTGDGDDDGGADDRGDDGDDDGGSVAEAWQQQSQQRVKTYSRGRRAAKDAGGGGGGDGYHNHGDANDDDDDPFFASSVRSGSIRSGGASSGSLRSGSYLGSGSRSAGEGGGGSSTAAASAPDTRPAPASPNKGPLSRGTGAVSSGAGDNAATLLRSAGRSAGRASGKPAATASPAKPAAASRSAACAGDADFNFEDETASAVIGGHGRGAGSSAAGHSSAASSGAGESNGGSQQLQSSASAASSTANSAATSSREGAAAGSGSLSVGSGTGSGTGSVPSLKRDGTLFGFFARRAATKPG